MANILTQNPLVLDTSGATIFFPGGIKVRHFEWSGYGAGNSAIVNNGLGKLVWQGTPTTDTQEVRSGQVGWVDTGIVLATLTGGKVLVYFE